MVLQPGETTTVNIQFTMPSGMGGKHDFRLHLITNDKQNPDEVVTILSNWIE